MILALATRRTQTFFLVIAWSRAQGSPCLVSTRADATQHLHSTLFILDLGFILLIMNYLNLHIEIATGVETEKLTALVEYCFEELTNQFDQLARHKHASNALQVRKLYHHRHIYLHSTRQNTHLSIH
jgi:hypothetical protein